MATWIMVFLRSFEEQLPPPIGQHHSLTFAQYGSDLEGWQDKLCLGIRRHNGSQNYFIEDRDLEPSGDPGECAKFLAASILREEMAR